MVLVMEVSTSLFNFSPNNTSLITSILKSKFDILLCFYRDRIFPNRFKQNQNKTSSDDFHSDNHKLCTTPIKNEHTKM